MRKSTKMRGSFFLTHPVQRPQLGLIIKNTKKVDIVTKHLSTQTNRKEKSFLNLLYNSSFLINIDIFYILNRLLA